MHGPGPDYLLKQVVEFDNLVVNGGLSAILSFFGNSGGASGFYFFGMDVDSGAIASADSVLSAETGSRTSAVMNQSLPRFTWSLTFLSGNPAGGDSIRILGVFNSLTGGILGVRASLSNSVIKGSADSLAVVWICSLAQ